MKTPSYEEVERLWQVADGAREFWKFQPNDDTKANYERAKRRAQEASKAYSEAQRRKRGRK